MKSPEFAKMFDDLLTNVEAEKTTGLESIFKEQPVDLQTFTNDPQFIRGIHLSDVQYEAVRRMERVLYPETYELMYKEFGEFWRPERIINFGTLEWGKGCPVAGEEIYCTESGRWIPIEQFPGGPVASTQDRKIVEDYASKSFKRGTGECFEVRTKRGKKARVYGGHQYLTETGWKKLWDISVGDKILSASTLPEPYDTATLPDHEIELVGMWLGDGIFSSSLKRHSVTMMFADWETRALDRYREILEILDVDIKVRTREGKRCFYVNGKIRPKGRTKVPSLNPLGRPRNPLNVLAEKYDLTGKIAQTKRVPPSFFQLNNKQICLFLSRLWGTDGWFYNPKDFTSSEAGYCTVSEGLAYDIQRLLLRIGVNAYVTERKTSSTFGRAWYVRFRKGYDLVRFCEQVETLDKYNEQQEIIDRYADINMSPQETHWDKIVSIESIGEHEYYDITVKDNANYVSSGGLLNHNSGKDLVCRLVSLRVAYILGCLHNPLIYFGLPPDDNIHLLNVAASAKQAQKAFFNPITKTTRSGWFKQRCTVRNESVEWDNGVIQISGHSDADLQEGLNLLLGVADEIDAFPTEQEARMNRGGSARLPTNSAEAVLRMLRTSAASRFPETFKVLRISYPRYKGSTIQNLRYQALKDIEKYGEESKHFVSGPLATWDVNPRIKSKDKFREDYEEDPVMARAMYECKPEWSQSPFFANQAAYEACEQDVEPIKVSYDWNEERASWEAHFDIPTSLKPIQGAIYAMHGDIAITGDRAGLAMAHLKQYDETTTTMFAWDGEQYYRKESLPRFVVDFVTYFEADASARPEPREVQIRWYQELLRELQYKGFNVRRYTFDGFQSASTMQHLEYQGIESERVSMDINDANWKNMRDLVLSGRVEIPKDELLRREVFQLTRLINGKLDHAPGGSKDLADSVCGALVGALAIGGQEVPDRRSVVLGGEQLYVPEPNDHHMPVGMAGGFSFGRDKIGMGAGAWNA